MGREVLKSAGLTPEDAVFLAAATAARMPGLVAGQIDAVALHPEDVYLGEKAKPGIHALVNSPTCCPITCSTPMAARSNGSRASVR